MTTSPTRRRDLRRSHGDAGHHGVDEGDGDDDDDDARPLRSPRRTESRTAKSAYLGVTLGEDTKSDEGGAVIKYLADDGPAAKAGLKKGDVIVSVDGTVVRGPARVSEKLRKSKPGDKMTVDARRDGKVQKFTVELGKRPQTVFSYRFGDDNLTDEQKAQLDMKLKESREAAQHPEPRQDEVLRARTSRDVHVGPTPAARRRDGRNHAGASRGVGRTEGCRRAGRQGHLPAARPRRAASRSAI